MRHTLEYLDDRTEKEFIQIFKKIPEETVFLDCRLNRFDKRIRNNKKILIEAFSCISDNVMHINFQYNLIFCGQPQFINHLKEVFICIPSTVVSMDLSNNGIETVNIENLKTLKDSLKNLKSVFLDYSSFAKIKFEEHSEEKLRLIGEIFPNVNEVIFLGSNGEERITDKFDNVLRRFYNAREFFLNPKIPSLTSQLAFFIAKRRNLKSMVPETLQFLCENTGADRYIEKEPTPNFNVW